jgi:chemotaxis protein methyltransferase CheR
VHADARSAPRWQRVSELIAARTGLHFPPERRADLERGLAEAARELGYHSCDACIDRLLTDGLPAGELRKLAGYLTVGETCFFRERASFNALATHVLPLLIQQRAATRRLRLWSAACSTGEEAYSLAIQLQQVLPEWREWDVNIVATDINPRSLREAETGVFGERSFRETAPGFREYFFSPAGDRRYRIRSELREMVRFGELNLVEDDFPPVDLALCRNLLVYFTPGQARRLVANLHRALGDDGWLVVSPAECAEALFEGFLPVDFPGCTLYRKVEGRAEVPSTVPLSEQADQVLSHESAALASEAASLGEPGPPAPAREIEKLRARARQLANRGELAEALEASERWIAADKLNAAAHYFIGMVLQELGERARARAALHRAVFLLPDFTLAHFALGNHARAQARHAEARRHFADAGRLLQGRPDDEPVPESDGITAGRLREIIDALVNDT